MSSCLMSAFNYLPRPGDLRKVRVVLDFLLDRGLDIGCLGAPLCLSAAVTMCAEYPLRNSSGSDSRVGFPLMSTLATFSGKRVCGVSATTDHAARRAPNAAAKGRSLPCRTASARPRRISIHDPEADLCVGSAARRDECMPEGTKQRQRRTLLGAPGVHAPSCRRHPAPSTLGVPGAGHCVMAYVLDLASAAPWRTIPATSGGVLPAFKNASGMTVQPRRGRC